MMGQKMKCWELSVALFPDIWRKLVQQYEANVQRERQSWGMGAERHSRSSSPSSPSPSWSLPIWTVHSSLLPSSWVPVNGNQERCDWFMYWKGCCENQCLTHSGDSTNVGLLLLYLMPKSECEKVRAIPEGITMQKGELVKRLTFLWTSQGKACKDKRKAPSTPPIHTHSLHPNLALQLWGSCTCPWHYQYFLQQTSVFLSESFALMPYNMIDLIVLISSPSLSRPTSVLLQVFQGGLALVGVGSEGGELGKELSSNCFLGGRIYKHIYAGHSGTRL